MLMMVSFVGSTDSSSLVWVTCVAIRQLLVFLVACQFSCFLCWGSCYDNLIGALRFLGVGWL